MRAALALALLASVALLASCEMLSHARAQDVFVPQGLKSSAEFFVTPRKTPPRIRIIRIPYRVWNGNDLKPCRSEK